MSFDKIWSLSEPFLGQNVHLIWKRAKKRAQESKGVPSVGFSLAGLDCAKLSVHQFQKFWFIVFIEISILLKPTF